MSCLLQLTSVTKSFGAVRALKGVSFDLRTGFSARPVFAPIAKRSGLFYDRP